MCDYTKREAAMVRIRENVWCDPCLVQLVRALYDNGFPTIASCCGHGKQSPYVMLADGREVLLADPEWAPVLWDAVVAHRDGARSDEQGAEVLEGGRRAAGRLGDNDGREGR